MNTPNLNLYVIEEFGRKQHKHHVRRDGTQYFEHCLKVGNKARQIASEIPHLNYGLDIVQAAGYLHDTIEDTRTDYDDIIKICGCLDGKTVADIVANVSDDKRLTGSLRHHCYMIQLSKSDILSQIVKLADTNDNTNDSFNLFQLENPPIAFLTRWHRNAVDTLNNLLLLKDNPHLISCMLDLVLLENQINIAYRNSYC